MYRKLYILPIFFCAMLSTLPIPKSLELWLARVTYYFNEEERDIYDSIRRLERNLLRCRTVEELQIYRRVELKRVYDLYANSKRSDFKPSLHKRIHRLMERYDERIDSIESNPE